MTFCCIKSEAQSAGYFQLPTVGMGQRENYLGLIGTKKQDSLKKRRTSQTCQLQSISFY